MTFNFQNKPILKGSSTQFILLFESTIKLSSYTIYYPLRGIPTRSLCPRATDGRATAVVRRSVGSEISNILDMSRRSPSRRAFPVAWRWSASCPIKRPYLQGHWRYTDAIICRRLPIIAPIWPKSPSGYGPLSFINLVYLKIR